MKMEPVASSNLKAVGHDPAANTLHVQFHNGQAWQYLGVDAVAHAALIASPTKGAHFHKHIRSCYHGTLCE